MTVRWKTVDRPGYMGDARDRLHSEWNSKYGAYCWRLAWEFGDLILEKTMAIQVYEDGYFEYFRGENGRGQADWLVRMASDVYDTAETNVSSGLDYSRQETSNNHLHDIAIRRAFVRLGISFKGDHLVWVRGPDSEGYRFNPGNVPFHYRELIYAGEIVNASGKNQWWGANTIEDFYQKNKVLQIWD